MCDSEKTGGVRAAQWFNLKCNLVVVEKKNPRKICCCFEKYQLESVRCQKTEPKTTWFYLIPVSIVCVISGINSVI